MLRIADLERSRLVSVFLTIFWMLRRSSETCCLRTRSFFSILLSLWRNFISRHLCCFQRQYTKVWALWTVHWVVCRNLGTRYKKLLLAHVYREKVWLSGDRVHVVGDGVCLSVRKVSREEKKTEAHVPAERWLARVLDELLRGQWLLSSANGVKMGMVVTGIHVFHGDIRM